MRRELSRKELLHRQNQSSTELSQNILDEHAARSFRETQYRGLYLTVKDAYEKLSKAYLRLKQTLAVSKNTPRDREVYHNDLLYRAPMETADRDITALENTSYSEAPRKSSLNLLLSSFPHPTYDASIPSSLPVAEPREGDQTLNRSTRTKDMVEEKIHQNHHRPWEAAGRIVSNIVPLPEESQAQHQFTKFTKKSTGVEDVKAPENDSDEPIVISERSLKRKRPDIKQHTASNARKDTHISIESLTNPVRVKSEPESGSPQSTLTHQSLAKPNDSIDLDDVGDRTLTPRKRRRVWACSPGKDDINCTTKDEDGATPIQIKRSRSPKGRMGYHSRTPNSPDKSYLFNQDRICDSSATSGRTARTVLGPIDQNRRMFPSTSDLSQDQQCAIETPRKSDEGISGVNYGSPSRDESPPITEPKFYAQGADFLRDYDVSIAEEKSTPSCSSQSETKVKQEETVSVIEARDSPRDLPLTKIYPEDFRLNPQHNQGLDYAYSEVVRGQDARKCLKGCTRPDCCGTLLRKAIEIGGYITPKSSRLANAIHDDEVEEDQQLLDDLLGDDKHRLKTMPEDEKKELLLQAQTEKFAKQYGKHRCAHGRASTPPGFWNTDMPTTQEEVENRKSANEMERRKVGEMYREATRPNGRYLFRD